MHVYSIITLLCFYCLLNNSWSFYSLADLLNNKVVSFVPKLLQLRHLDAVDYEVCVLRLALEQIRQLHGCKRGLTSRLQTLNTSCVFREFVQSICRNWFCLSNGIDHVSDTDYQNLSAAGFQVDFVLYSFEYKFTGGESRTNSTVRGDTVSDAKVKRNPFKLCLLFIYLLCNLTFCRFCRLHTA